MSFQVKAEKLIQRTAKDVFQAIQEGRLFLNCGADLSTIEIDFRVGGKYKINYERFKFSNFGEFLEIIPYKKVAFSWCQNFAPDQKPDSKVTIELFEDGPKTRMTLLHTGFRTQEIANQHQGGWDGAVNDMGEEIYGGRLRFTRSFKAPVEKLFATCADPKTFFAYMGDLPKGTVDFKVGGKYEVPNDNDGIKGEFLEIVQNKKIAFSWLKGCTGPLKNSKVTLNFDTKNENAAKFELIHEGLVSKEDQAAHREGWEHVFNNIAKKLGWG